jgi:hypothetical protein
LRVSIEKYERSPESNRIPSALYLSNPTRKRVRTQNSTETLREMKLLVRCHILSNKHKSSHVSSLIMCCSLTHLEPVSEMHTQVHGEQEQQHKSLEDRFSRPVITLLIIPYTH